MIIIDQFYNGLQFDDKNTSVSHIHIMAKMSAQSCHFYEKLIIQSVYIVDH